MKTSAERNKEFTLKIGDECKSKYGTIIIDSLPDEFTRISYSVKDGHGGGHMGYQHWKRLERV